MNVRVHVPRLIALLLAVGGPLLSPAIVRAQATTQMLASYAALRFCAYRLEGLGREEATETALADVQTQYYALLKGQLDLIRRQFPPLASQRCPEVDPRKPPRVQQPPLVQRQVGPCTPTMADAQRAASGQSVQLGTRACQIQFN